MNSRLWDNDAFWGIYCQVYGEATAKPYRDILDRFAGDDKLTIGSEKFSSRQLRLQGFERQIHLVLTAVVAIGGNTLLEGVEKGDILTLQRNDFIPEMDKKRVLLLLLALCYAIDAR